VHRIKLLGGLLITAVDGTPLSPPRPKSFRLLVALALRPGERRTVAELSAVVWDDWTAGIGPNLETPMSRLRGVIPIDEKARGTDTYRTSLRRSEVDATDFIDTVNGGDLDVDQVDDLLALWRGDPVKLYPFIPPTEWGSLLRARAHLVEELGSWSRSELGRLDSLESFCAHFPAETEQLVPAEGCQRKRLLIVDDDEQLTRMLADLLHDHHCVIAHTVAEAIDVVSDTRSGLDGALVDLHLTRHLDSSGIAILSALQSLRPDVPRILLTSSPPAGGMTEVLRAYGLFEVLVKDGANAPVRTRTTVDAMLGTSPESARRRAAATFESVAVTVERRIQAAIVQTRKRERRGEPQDPATKDQLIDKFTTLTDEIASTRHLVDSCPAGELQGHVTSFTTRWSGYLEQADDTV
jgi:DNA-binding response OmpR family regulator